MQQQWQQLADKFIQLSMRERVMLLSVMLFGIVYLLYSFVIEPANLKSQRLQAQIILKKQEKNQLTFDNLALSETLRSDPNSATKVQLSQTKLALSQTASELELFTSDLIGSAEMALVLGDVLTKANQVKLLTVESLPVVVLSSGSGVAAGDKQKDKKTAEKQVKAPVHKVNIYRHSLRMTLTGEYFAIQAYLQSIEDLPKKLYWQVFDYELEEYPQAKVVMEFYTLSLNKEFIRG